MAREPRKAGRKERGEETGTKTWVYVALIILISGGALPVLLPMFEKLPELFPSFFSAGEVTQLDPNSTDLSKVFFSGEPWLVLCKNKTERNNKVWRFVRDAHGNDANTEGLQLGVLPCFEKLPSGKNIYERFKMSPPPTNVYVPKPAPHAFYVANGKRPVMIPQKFFQYNDPVPQVGEKILNFVKKKIKVSVSIVANTVELTKKCLKHGSCVLLLNDGKLSQADNVVVQELMNSHRLKSFARLDTTKRKLSLQGKLPELKGGDSSKPRLVLIKKNKATKGFLAKALGEEFNFYNADQFLQHADDGGWSNDDDSVISLKKAPKITSNEKNKKKKKKTKNSSEHPDGKPNKNKKPKQKKEKTTEKPADDAQQKKREQQRRAEMDRETKESMAHGVEDEEEVQDLDEDETVFLDDDEVEAQDDDDEEVAVLEDDDDEEAAVLEDDDGGDDEKTEL